MTKTCAYCGTPVKFKTSGEGFENQTAASCDFCEMELNIETEICENGNRKLRSVPPVVDSTQIYEKTKGLMKLSVFELLCLLKEVNRERTEMYANLTQAKKWKEEALLAAVVDPITLETINTTLETVGEEYEFFSKKKWVIENILTSRIDQLPARITDKFLNEYWEKTLKTNQRLKPMGFNKAK